jgi:hypothetical protein
MEAIFPLCTQRKIVHESYVRSATMHNVPLVGHCGKKTTWPTLNKSFYWPNMKEDVEHYVHICA